MTSQPAKQVSFDDEPLIVVDEDNNVLDYRPKADVHKGEGILHRAFSVFLFNEAGEVLLQQRSGDKPLWPLFWSNSCCSHPRRGESEPEAAARRIEEELGLRTELEHVYTFTYHARYDETGSEREICSVFLGHAVGPVVANENEIADWRWISADDLTAALENDGHRYTPWFKMEWKQLREQHAEAMARYTEPGPNPPISNPAG